MATAQEKALDLLKPALIEDLGIEAHEITSEATLEEDLRADSLDIVELVMRLEEDHRIEISDDEAEQLETVGSLVDLLVSHLKLQDDMIETA